MPKGKKRVIADTPETPFYRPTSSSFKFTAPPPVLIPVFSPMPSLRNDNLGYNPVEGIAFNSDSVKAVIQPEPIIEEVFLASIENPYLIKRTLDELKEDLLKINFTQAEIAKMKKNQVDDVALVAVIKHYDQLRNLDFYNADIVKMASNNGAHFILIAVIKHYDQLRNLDFDNTDIVKMASNNGAHFILIDTIKYYDQLRKLDFDNKQIRDMASHDGGSLNIRALIKNYDQLRKLDFDNIQIRNMVAHDGGSRNLRAVIKHYDKLTRKFGFDNTQIEKIASRDGGSLNIRAVIKNYAKLKKFGFDNTQITNIVSRYSGGVTLDALCECYESLCALGFTAVELVQIIVSHLSGGAKIIRVINSHFDRLVDVGLDVQKIIKLATTRGAKGREKLIGYTLKVANVSEIEDEKGYEKVNELENETQYTFFPDNVPLEEAGYDQPDDSDISNIERSAFPDIPYRLSGMSNH